MCAGLRPLKMRLMQAKKMMPTSKNQLLSSSLSVASAIYITSLKRVQI